MVLKNAQVSHLLKYIREGKKKVVVFGAGVIGTAVLQSIFQDAGILDRILYYVDNDKQKQGKEISVYEKSFAIKDAEALKGVDSRDTVIIVTISQYGSVIEQLDCMENLKEAECYILPIMYISHLTSKKDYGVIMQSDTQLIPKVLHYIWIGDNKMPAELVKCIDTWKEYCPDYEIICWNEKNYDFSKNNYMKQAMAAKKWGFATDYARLDILYQHGGIYLDTDVYLIKNLDELLYQEAFCSTEKWNVINSGGCAGTIKNGAAVKAMLDFREPYEFINADGTYNLLASGFYENQAMIAHGYKLNGETQTVLGMNIYPYDFFHPYDYMSGQLQKTKNTFSVHCFNGGWITDEMNTQRKLTQENYNQILSRM